MDDALKKEASLTTGGIDAKPKDYSVLRSVFLEYCAERELNIREAGGLLKRLKKDLQKQLCSTAIRKCFDETGNKIRYY